MIIEHAGSVREHNNLIIHRLGWTGEDACFLHHSLAGWGCCSCLGSLSHTHTRTHTHCTGLQKHLHALLRITVKIVVINNAWFSFYKVHLYPRLSHTLTPFKFPQTTSDSLAMLSPSSSSTIFIFNVKSVWRWPAALLSAYPEIVQNAPSKNNQSPIFLQLFRSERRAVRGGTSGSSQLRIPQSLSHPRGISETPSS